MNGDPIDAEVQQVTQEVLDAEIRGILERFLTGKARDDDRQLLDQCLEVMGER